MPSVTPDRGLRLRLILRGPDGASLARPKSRIFTRSSLGDEDVFRLQIAMDDAFVVCGRQALNQLIGVLERFGFREGAGASSLPQGHALEQFGHQVRENRPARPIA